MPEQKIYNRGHTRLENGEYEQTMVDFGAAIANQPTTRVPSRLLSRKSALSVGSNTIHDESRPAVV